MKMVNTVVLITGASRGIGAAAARLFAAEGARVGLAARSFDAVKALSGEIGETALPLACDVRDFAAVSGAVTAVLEQFGRLDVLINNAGVIEPIAHMAESDPEGWSQVIDINLKGVYYGMRAALPHMLAQGGGSVLTVSSGAAHGPTEAWSHYNASKAGAAMLRRSLHHDYGDKGIRSMGLSPGTVATEMQREIKASGINRVSKLDRSDPPPPQWPAKALVWMATPEADAFIGEEISLRDEAIRARLGLVG